MTRQRWRPYTRKVEREKDIKTALTVILQIIVEIVLLIVFLEHVTKLSFVRLLIRRQQHQFVAY